jgi:5'-3' exonuclease
VRALLDGDLYCFRSAASSENEDLGIAIFRCEDMIDNTLAEVGAEEFSIFLSGDNNFRYDIYPEYKANRTAPKPRHLRALKDYLIEKYQAQVSDGCEADDLLGIEQCEFLGPPDFGLPRQQTIICSLDKDLRMIPGWHYSFEISGTSSLGKKWVKEAEKVYVEPFEGLKRFYTQVLTGDSTDNLKGCAGIGKVKAEKLLADCQTEEEMFDVVRDAFGNDAEFYMNAVCIWIMRQPNTPWKPLKELDIETGFG